MNIHAADERQTFWQVVVHLTFVASGVLLATMDWIAGKARALHEGALIRRSCCRQARPGCWSLAEEYG
jgi:hypothetical protein